MSAPSGRAIAGRVLLRVDKDEDLALVLSTKILEQRLDAAWIGV